MEAKGIGAFVREKRNDLGWTQATLADRAGVERARIAQIEGGRVTLPGAEHRRRIATALGVSHLELLIAAGEITEAEVTQAGAVGVIEHDPDDPTDDLVQMVRAINWRAQPEWAEGLKALMGRLRGDQAKT